MALHFERLAKARDVKRNGTISLCGGYRNSDLAGLARESEPSKLVVSQAAIGAACDYVKLLPLEERKAINSRYRQERKSGLTDLNYGEWLFETLPR